MREVFVEVRTMLKVTAPEGAATAAEAAAAIAKALAERGDVWSARDEPLQTEKGAARVWAAREGGLLEIAVGVEDSEGLVFESFDEVLDNQDDVKEGLEAALEVLRAHPDAADPQSPLQLAIRKMARMVGEG